MTYEYVVVNDRPSAAFNLDYQPFRDFSGNGIRAGGQRVVNYTGNPIFATDLSGMRSAGGVNGTRVRDTGGDALFSNAAVVVTVTGTGQYGTGTLFNATIPTVNYDRTMTMGAWVMSSSGKNINVLAEWYTGANVYGGLQGTTGPAFDVNNTSWQFLKRTFTLPAGAYDVRSGPHMPVPAVGDSYRIGAVILVEGTELNASDFGYQEFFESYQEGGHWVMHKPLTLAESLVSGGGSAALVNAQNTLDINYVRPNGPFSVEAWFKPVNVASRMTIADGIDFDGEAIYFYTEYKNSGRCETVYFPPLVDRVFHVVGEHDNTSNRLWVDGFQVSEAVMTPEQVADTYVNAEVVPSGTGGGSAIVDGLAFYDRVIAPSIIVNHYYAGTRAQDYKSLISTMGGSYWTLSDNETNIALTLSFGDWNQGIMSNVLPESGVLRPEVSDLGVTYGGSWAYGLPLNTVGAFIDGSRITWDGDGTFVVQTSMDNELTWQNAVNGREVEGLSGGFATEGQSLSVRIVFSTGEPADHITAVRSLTVTLYAARDLINSQGAQFVQPVGSVGIADAEYPVLEKNAHMGVELYNGGSILVTPRNLDEVDGATSSVEMWLDWPGEDGVLFQAGDAYVRMVNGKWEFSGVTVYLNGSRSFNLDIANNIWTHVFLVLDTPVNDAFTISGNCRIGILATYRTQVDSSDIGTLYNNYLGIASVSMQEESVISVTDSVTPPSIYAYNWSIISSA